MHATTAAACLAMLAVSGTAQPIAQAEPTPAEALSARYEGISLVRITHRDQAALDTVKAMNLRLMSEREGVGPVEYLADQAQIRRLRALGLDLEILADDVAEHVAQERARIDANARALGRGLAFFNDFRVFDDPAGQDVVDISDFIDDLAQNNPGLVSIETVGTSVQGRAIRGLSVSGAGDAASKPLIFINAGIHAREWLSPTTALWILDSLVEGYANDPRITTILDNTAFFIIPVSNPDGYTYTHTTSRFWRKNRRNNGNGTVGVDLNRNFGFEWGGLGADTSSSSDIYRGTGPFSEPETRTIRDAVLARPNTTVFVDVHTFSQLILYPWGYDTVLPAEPDRSTFERLSDEIRDEILSISGVEYTPIPSHDLYPASGVAGDWGYGGAGALSWTYELRPRSGNLDGFAPEPDQIIPTGEEILETFLHLAELAIEGVRFSFPAGIPAELSEGEQTPVSFEALPVLRASIDTTSARAMVRTQGQPGFTPVPATNTSGINFTAMLPSAQCGDQTDLYFQIADTSGALYTYPAGAPKDVLSLDVIRRTTAFADSFESDRGWTASGDASTGHWERGVPVDSDRLDPPADADGNGFAYLTENAAGNFDVDGGRAILTSPAFDLAQGDALSYAYWIDGTDGVLTEGDGLFVEYSTDDGSTWRNLRSYTQGAEDWRYDSFVVGTELPASTTTRLRFIAADVGEGDVIEAGLDDFTIAAVEPCPNVCLADVNQNGSVEPTDFGAWLNAFNAGDPLADQNQNGSVEPTDFGAWLANFNAGCD